MNLSYFPNNIALNGNEVMQAFIKGCQRLGINTVANELNADVAVIWSMLWAGRMQSNQSIWTHYRSQGKPVVVIEVGAIQRGHTWKIGLNGINGSGYFGSGGNDSQRADMLKLIADDWRKPGKEILICLQRSQSHQWSQMPSTEIWLSDTIRKIRSYTDRPIIVRPHPRQRLKGSWKDVTVQVPLKLVGTYDDFDFDAHKTWAVVNWNSNPGVLSVMSGIPAFVGGDSLAAPVGNLDLASIENPRRPDRRQWINDLAYTEWTVEEIASGLPLSRLLQL